ncbi:hypothetical protein [Rosenbergiella metrosideri]|uniref:hypothetical protein n=1 Tax=Rosenbergiella metrosideri TaxID=2921185 RepID=UPI001F4F6DE1|nr:hypothetical protein [Rosenbergiella metrosideri]
MSAVGSNISNIAIGSGNISFWRKVFLDNDKKTLPLSNNNKNMMYLNKMEHYIGDINFFLEKKGLTTPIITLEADYIYISYIGSASPIPSSMKRKIILTPFK